MAALLAEKTVCGLRFVRYSFVSKILSIKMCRQDEKHSKRKVQQDGYPAPIFNAAGAFFAKRLPRDGICTDPEPRMRVQADRLDSQNLVKPMTHHEISIKCNKDAV